MQNISIRNANKNPNGKIEKVVDCEEDKKTVVKQDFYNYKSDKETIDNIITKFPDGIVQTGWYGENGKVEVRCFQDGTKLIKTEWYYEDGETVRIISTPLENGGQEITKYEKDGRIINVCLTKPDKTTIDEYSKYYYDDKTKALRHIYSTFSNDTELTTWYGENEIATVSTQSQKGIKTNTTWYFEDGKTPNIMELYLEDGRKQKVIYDKNERWLEFLEYPAIDSTQYSKKTTFSYTSDKKVPQISTTVYPYGKLEKAWYDEKENMTCRQTLQNNVLQKTEWFYEDGVTVKVLRTYKQDGTHTDERFPRKNVSAA